MENLPSPRLKKLKSPQQDLSLKNLNLKNCITCKNVPFGLFEQGAAKKHFNKFGRVHRIRLYPKRQTCIVEYEQATSMERAVLNAGAYDGFMFDVTRTSARIRRKSKKEEDPDWLPDPDVAEELTAMSGAPNYRLPRQTSMALDAEQKPKKMMTPKREPVRKSFSNKTANILNVVPVHSIKMDLPVSVVTAQTTLSTSEAAAELHQLRSRVSLTPDEQWRTLDTRDRILRAWGGTGRRARAGGATLGTCRDMCPEKERLHRQAEHQVMTLETELGSDGSLDVSRAVKQYSRSSADQEMPMCYELRPPAALAMTAAYLLHEIVDTNRQVALADWFHFLWDRFRSIRKDITQQALCCAESIRLVELCARFHAHCAARLADLEHAQFDPKLNTDNLTKCLQTLKHMYADVQPHHKPKEAEFRGYIALLNLGDANFWWEIKQLPREIQKSEPIMFAINVFNALDNNNYVRFFRLVREKATYLQACILLRYFNDVRARALARVTKAFAPRGGSRYPAADLTAALAFQSPDAARAFTGHYGLRWARTDDAEPAVILDRNQFIEDSDPFPAAREPALIEVKRRCSVGEVIAGGPLPDDDFRNHKLHCSFNTDGTLKEGELLAEDLGYDTLNNTNKDIQSLKAELLRLGQASSRNFGSGIVNNADVFVKPEPKSFSPKSTFKVPPATQTIASHSPSKLFSFKPAITVAPTDIIEKSPENIFDRSTNNIFSFSKPTETVAPSTFTEKRASNLFSKPQEIPVFGNKLGTASSSIFSKANIENKEPLSSSQNLFKAPTLGESNLFKKPESVKPLFGDVSNELKDGKSSVFSQGNIVYKPGTNLFTKKDPEIVEPTKSLSGNVFGKVETNKFESKGNLFNIKAEKVETLVGNDPKSIFGNFKPEAKPSIFSQPTEQGSKSLVGWNGDASAKLSPGSLFKSVVNGSETDAFSIFKSKAKVAQPSVAPNIFNSVNSQNAKIYDFNEQEENSSMKLEEQRRQDEVRQQEEARKKEEMQKQFEKQQEMRRQEEQRQQEEHRRLEEARQKEEARKIEEMRRKKEELKRLEEKRREEERRQLELKKKLEEENRLAELKRKEEERKFLEQVEMESSELVDELVNEVSMDTVTTLVKEETQIFNKLMSYAQQVNDEILNELCNDICVAEAKAEKHLTEQLMKKWATIWKRNLIRNVKRRRFLDDTPIWLTEKSPKEQARSLRRCVEQSALKNMNAFHKGYRFNGELNIMPTPSSYNLMEIIKSPLLKRLKKICYPYDKCFFWKVSLVSSEPTKWLCKKINMEKWLMDVFSDKKKHDVSDSLIQVGKQSWNNLMNFAISVSLTNRRDKNKYDAYEGSNGILYFMTEEDTELMEVIEETLQYKYPLQIIPVAVVMPSMPDQTMQSKLEQYLSSLVSRNVISNYKILLVDPERIGESLNSCTKSALKWLAKHYPPTPPLEIDLLKSICQRYLGNEIWHRLKLERETRLREILRDIRKLVGIYNIAVDKLTTVITNEELFNFPTFPLEFKQYLNKNNPYPMPYEFIPANVKNSENVSAIKDIMQQLKLPDPQVLFNPVSAVTIQDNIRTYCKQIGWFQNPEKVVCKVVARWPSEFCDELPSRDFSNLFKHYDMLDILNIIVYEKINCLNNFNKTFAIYDKSELECYRNCDWWYDLDILSNVKHKALDYEDEFEYITDTKRRKITNESFEYLMLEDNDRSMADESIKETDEKISKYNNCSEAVKQLEEQLELEKIKSIELENLLKSALSEC